jgi:hypothetical protein
VLLRIRRRDLAAELLEALDDPDGALAVTNVIRGGGPRGARSQNRHVDDAVVHHAGW